VLVDAAHATGAAIESGIGAGAAPQNGVQGAKKRGSHSAAVGKVKLRKPYTAQGGVVALGVASERVHALLAGVQSRPRAVCGVANPRHSYGYVCGLRLAAHPDPHPAPLRAQSVNTF